MVHVGVDLHKRSAQLAVLMPDGELTQQRLENDPERLERFLAQFPRGARVAIEASGTWWWFVDLVERLGHQAVLSNPSNRPRSPRFGRRSLQSGPGILRTITRCKRAQSASFA